MKKLLLVVGGISAALVVGLLILINTAPPLPEETDAIIEQVFSADIPELITGVTGTAKSGDIEIWYEVINPAGPPKGTVLLIMGHSASALFWPEYFFRPLVEAGYRVIRYDNRGVGMSDWMNDGAKRYTLEDMARDALAVLDANGIEQAHVIGASMGGMIGQRLAISNGNRLLSLASIMSTGYFDDPDLPGTPIAVFFNLTRYILKYAVWKTEEDMIRFNLGLLQLLQGNTDNPYDLVAFTQQVVYEMRRRRGYNHHVGRQHTKAILASGSRYDELGIIKAPILIIHGRSDPIIPFAHALK
ncbi:MAG: alpha/beta fold hydrolase, partial [Proteobacteria bacterium]|nr:alpha/beta fold hydrolase [Pseudomonadota bacterium]